jgi:hypothetical protein
VDHLIALGQQLSARVSLLEGVYESQDVGLALSEAPEAEIGHWGDSSGCHRAGAL